MTPEAFATIAAASAPSFSRDGQTLFHLRGAGMMQPWALDLANGADRQLASHDDPSRSCAVRRWTTG